MKLVLALIALTFASVYAIPVDTPITVNQNGPTATNQTLVGQTQGINYVVAVPQSDVLAFTNFVFSIRITPANSVVHYSVTAYQKFDGTTWQALTPTSWYSLEGDAVQTSGYLAVSVDPKVLYDNILTRTSTNIGFWVQIYSGTPPNGQYFDVYMRKYAGPVNMDSNSEIGVDGVESTAKSSTCPGTAGRMMATAVMNAKDHKYLEAHITNTGGVFNYARLRNTNCVIDGFCDDIKYFSASTSEVFVRTCLTNDTCSIVGKPYWVEVRSSTVQGGSIVNDNAATWNVQWTTKAGASAVSASAFTVLAAIVAAIVAKQ
jgi:hypothetical protein